MSAVSPFTVQAPIGIFDSGVGGLSVLREVQRLLPHENILYLADTANVPYGDKPITVVRDLALRLTAHLVQSGCKLIIMASGTSTVAGLEAAQVVYPGIPIFGTIDVGARAALAALQGLKGTIGVLATNATVHSLAFTQAVRTLAPEQNVVEVGCPRFVPLVESGQTETPDALDAAQIYLAPLRAANAQAIILGCTHFPFLLPALRRALAGENYAPVFVDPATEAVRAASSYLASAHCAAPGETPGTLTFAATGDPEDFRHHASALLGVALPPVGSLFL